MKLKDRIKVLQKLTDQMFCDESMSDALPHGLKFAPIRPANDAVVFTALYNTLPDLIKWIEKATAPLEYFSEVEGCLCRALKKDFGEQALPCLSCLAGRLVEEMK